MIKDMDTLYSVLLDLYRTTQKARTGIDDKALATAIGIKPSQLIAITNAMYFLEDWMQHAEPSTPSLLSKIFRVDVVKQFFQAVFVVHIPKHLVYSRVWKQSDGMPKPVLDMAYLRRKKSKMLNWSGMSKPQYRLDPVLKHLSVTTIAEQVDPSLIVFFNSYNIYKAKYNTLKSVCNTILDDGLSSHWADTIKGKTQRFPSCENTSDFLRNIVGTVTLMDKFNYEYEVITLQQEARCRVVRIGKSVLKHYA
jgi:hypothetical protein